MTRARAPIDATRAWEAAETLEAILGPGVDLVHTKRLGWILRAWDSWEGPNGPRDGWKEVDSAPDGQLGALLIRHQRRVRGEHV
jgi:hypothetical protein